MSGIRKCFPGEGEFFVAGMHQLARDFRSNSKNVWVILWGHGLVSMIDPLISG